jgi:NAD(P)-dependent dehydrogenase (short-subunit alcohol dehydrogenase family)
MEFGLQDRVVLVTGATSGIGRATAIAFGTEGARVALTYHTNREGAETTAKEVETAGGQSMVVAYDLGDKASIDAAVGTVAERWGGINVLVANAVEWGAPAWAPPAFEDLDPNGWQRSLRTGLDGVFHTLQAALPVMRNRPGARIVLVSSGSVDYGMVGEAAYGSAKAGLHGLARSLARELGPAGVLVNVVMPGLVATERNLQMIPQEVRDTIAGHSCTGRLTCPDEVAAAIVFLSSLANSNVTGETLHIAGGM